MTNKTKTTATTKSSKIFTIVGNIGKDCTVTPFASGNQVARTSIAVRQGSSEAPRWYSIEAWDKIAEFMKDACYKGARVTLTGYIDIQEYVDKATEEIKTKEVFKILWIDRCVKTMKAA